jgi:prepilin-type N-terminal cleavage/methylation domain-containing protein
MIGQRGFSLPEVLAALTITAMALVAAATFLSAHARATRRLEVHEQLVRTAELALESLRGRATALEPAVFDPAEEVDPEIGLSQVAVVDVRTTDVPGLHHVAVTARDEVDGVEVVVRLETMVFRP